MAHSNPHYTITPSLADISLALHNVQVRRFSEDDIDRIMLKAAGMGLPLGAGSPLELLTIGELAIIVGDYDA